MPPGPYSRSTTFDNELSLCRFPRLIVSPRTANMISSLCRTHGSNNLLLHHSFDLMSSPTDYIFMKPLNKCVVIIINTLSVSRISIKFMMGNTILVPRWLCYHRKHSCLPQHKLIHVMDATCYPSCMMFYLEVLLSFMTRVLWGLLHLLRILGIVILLTITILSWSSSWFLTGYQQVNGAVWIMPF